MKSSGHKSVLDNGWCVFDHDPVLAHWVEHTLPAARETLNDPNQAQWLRCGGTWFAGVNALPNDGNGAVAGGPALAGTAFEAIRQSFGFPVFEWERAQVSICYPGYPRPMDGESEKAFGFRLKRDAAHVDGLIPDRQHGGRYLQEYHGFLFGIPMTETDAGAAPFVVWRGSHEIVRAALKRLFADRAPSAWCEVDVTETYQAARREIFETCERVEVHCQPGQSYVVHRLALHGVAPWAESVDAGPDGRMIVYFRPEIGGPEDWLNQA